MKTQMEALIYHFKIVTEGFHVPAGEVYQAVESPRGELGYYVVSNGTSRPWRVHMRTPSFGNLQSLPAMIEGRLIADTIASMGSMDFVLGDVDR
jgi:NADH-quinone oxidoreductase subunit D